MKDLIFLSAIPDDHYFIFQVETQINSFQKFGYSEKMHILLYRAPDRPEWNKEWEILEQRYPEVKFFRYEDRGIFNILRNVYLPILRPHIIWQHFEKYTELSEKAIFYHDSDITIHSTIPFEKWLDDDICYMSNTNSYINASYWDSKVNDVLPSKLEEYKKVDVLDEACKLVGITREIAVKNNEHSGGAQTLFKNIDANYWKKVEEDCIKIRIYLSGINSKYFESEDRGLQGFCSDMWSCLWNTWLRGTETKIVPELSFVWATDHISKWDSSSIFHNAGAGPQPMRVGDVDHQIFFKGHYASNQKSPFDDKEQPYLDATSPDFCTYNYVQEIKEVRNKYYK